MQSAILSHNALEWRTSVWIYNIFDKSVKEAECDYQYKYAESTAQKIGVLYWRQYRIDNDSDKYDSHYMRKTASSFSSLRSNEYFQYIVMTICFPYMYNAYITNLENTFNIIWWR